MRQSPSGDTGLERRRGFSRRIAACCAAIALLYIAGNCERAISQQKPLSLVERQALQSTAEKAAADLAQRVTLAPELVLRIQKMRGMSADSLAALPAARVPRLVRRLEQPDLPRERARFRVLQLKDETSSIPSGAMLNALKQLQERRKQQPLQLQKVGGVPVGDVLGPEKLQPLTAGLNPGHWKSIGPGNIGGRTRSIVIHPTTPEVMWAGSVAGGVWKSSNGGKSWAPVDDFMANLAVCSMVMDPRDPNTIYAGTGEGFYNGDAIRGGGLFVTKDGKQWHSIASTKGEDFQFCNRLAISADGKTLLAGTRTGLFRSDDEARSNWKKVHDGEIADVDFHPTDSNKAVLGQLYYGNAYFSTDGGATWKESEHNEPWDSRIEVTYARQNPDIVFASVDIRDGEIWRSVDGGKTFARRRNVTAAGVNTSYLGGQGWYDNVIWAGDPTNSDLVIVGGIDLWKSTDGGDTLIDISTWWKSPESAHADHHAIVAHPKFDGQTNKSVFFGNDGGIYMTSNVYTVGNNAQAPRTNGWVELNNEYGVTQFFGAAATSDGVIFAGAQDNGTLRYTKAGGSDGWTTIAGGDGGHCAADPTDPKIAYGQYQNLNLFRIADGGDQLEMISGNVWNESLGIWEWKKVPYTIPDARCKLANFIAPFVLDPNEPNRILAGGHSLWRTNDAKTKTTDKDGPKWASIKSSTGEPISAIDVAAGDSNTIWVGHNDGSIFKTTEGTLANPLWQRVDTSGQPALPDRYCTRIVIDPKDHKRVFLTFAGFRRENVWRTLDGGLTWRDAGAGTLPEAPVRTLAIHPKEPKYLYIGTEVGVFASEDGGNTWTSTNEGPTNCSVDHLFFSGTTLVAATHGRGIFMIDLKLP